MTKNRLHSRPSLAPMLSYSFVCLFIHQEFYGRPTDMATTITLPFTNSCISSWRIFTTNLVKSSWRILVSLFYRQGNRVPKRMSFLPVVTQHRTAHWGLQGSAWSCCTSLSNPITKFQSHGPSLCSTKIWIHFVHCIFLGHFLSSLHVADSLPVRARFKHHLIREASHKHSVQRGSYSPIIITLFCFCFFIALIIIWYYLLHLLFVSCLLLLSSFRI